MSKTVQKNPTKKNAGIRELLLSGNAEHTLRPSGETKNNSDKETLKANLEAPGSDDVNPISQPDKPGLKADENETLKRCEESIQGYRMCFVEAGKAFVKINRERFYRATHSTFEKYCRQRCAFSPQLLKGASIASVIATFVEKHGKAPLYSEGQLRPPAQIKETEDIPVLWKFVVEKSGDKQITARLPEERINELEWERKPAPECRVLHSLTPHEP